MLNCQRVSGEVMLIGDILPDPWLTKVELSKRHEVTGLLKTPKTSLGMSWQKRGNLVIGTCLTPFRVVGIWLV